MVSGGAAWPHLMWHGIDRCSMASVGVACPQ